LLGHDVGFHSGRRNGRGGGGQRSRFKCLGRFRVIADPSMRFD
jgi:hypothetical protein